jgi:AbiV family abortive infection protein
MIEEHDQEMSKSQGGIGGGGGNSYYTMDRLGLLIGNYICIQKAKQLADSALKLLDSDDGNDHTNALGLYTLAIEEFGKAVILKEECFVDNDAVTQKVPMSIFTGNKAHDRKFEEAMKRLPRECKNIRVGTYLAFPSGKPTKVRLGREGPYIRVPPDKSGNFFATYTTNIDMRLSCFYVDWDETKRRWVFNMKVEKKEELRKALNKFKEKIVDYEIVTEIQRKAQGRQQSP